MDSQIEEKRSLHEERDRIELAVVNEMLGKKTSHRDRLDSEHRQKALLDRYMKCSQNLLSLYEIQPLDQDQNQPKVHSDAFNDFYLALRNIKEFYNKHANEVVVTLASEFEEIETARLVSQGIQSKSNNGNNDGEPKRVAQSDDEDVEEELIGREGEIDRLTRGLPSKDLVEIVEAPTNQQAQQQNKLERQVFFTDEEGYGRYLDLNECHEAFLQVIKKSDVKPNYLSFLDSFDNFKSLDTSTKMTRAYKTYVEMMLDYFRNYCKRAKPLFDYQDFEEKIQKDFIERWNNKNVPGWFEKPENTDIDEVSQIDLTTYESCEELKQLGLDCLKRELQVRGLKCGGTLDDRANRLWSIRDKEPHDIPDCLRSTPFNKRHKKSDSQPFTIASIEAKLGMYAEFFADIRQGTIENVQRKQARTAEERNESDEDISDIEDEDSSQADVVYNPKNLPLGWDGKPIPYWLYKLHGLNQSFTCEICGNAIYKGPKTFQRHFAEWRHAHGMRCLGIPNTAHFANITKIQDAIKLWDKLKNEKQKGKSQNVYEEEYEDSQGNVVNKKTYEDLKRQGLL